MPKHPSRRPGELTFALILVLVSMIAFSLAFDISGFTGLSKPGVFPMLAAAAMFLSALFILRNIFSVRQPDFAGKEFAMFLKEVVPLKLVGMIGLIILYVIAMPWFGFVISSGAFLFTAFAFLWRNTLFKSAALSLVSLAIIYVIFRKIFLVVLPQGTLIQGLF